MAEDRLSIFQVAVFALPWIGIQAIWATEFGVLTPVLESYGLSKSLSSLIWIFGPLTGFFTAPAVGAFSDRSTSKYGRRRPFLLAGLLSTMIASAVFAFSYKMGDARIAVGLISFICLDITINVIQTPLRAFCSDMVPESQQSVVQLLSALFQGLGGLLGFALMSALWTGDDPSELPALFGTVMAVNIFFLGLTCVVVHEKPVTKEEAAARGDNATSIGATFVQAFLGIFSAKLQPVLLILLVEFFSWAALFSWWPTSSTWFSRNVYGGCLEADGPSCTPEGIQLYKDGSKVYGNSGIYANLLQTVFSLVLALSLQNGWIKRVKVPYMICLAVGAVILILAKVGPQSHAFGYAVAVLMAVPISAINSFPFAIIGAHNARAGNNDTGRTMGMINIAICLPQLLMTVCIGWLRDGLGDAGLPWGLLIAGISLGVAAVTVLVIREEDREEAVPSIKA